MATDRKPWPKGAGAARTGSIGAQGNIIDFARSSRALIRDARHAKDRQDWQHLEMILLRLDAQLADIRSEAEYTMRVLGDAKPGEE